MYCFGAKKDTISLCSIAHYQTAQQRTLVSRCCRNALKELRSGEEEDDKRTVEELLQDVMEEMMDLGHSAQRRDEVYWKAVIEGGRILQG
jgi:hypothetical protein